MDDQTVETDKDFGEGQVALVKRWMAEIKIYDKECTGAGDAADWHKQGEKIIKRYRDERKAGDSSRKLNLLWANVQLQGPALYSNTPKPEAVRRFKDKDPVGRAAAMLIERCASYVIDTQPFDDVIRGAVQDRLLPGRGQTWIRYVPTMQSHTPRIPVNPSEVVNEEFNEQGELASSVLNYTDDDGTVYEEGNTKEDDDGRYVDGEPYDDVQWEDVFVDHLNWKDFGHTPARTWQEVRAVWRRAHMTRTQLEARFDKKIVAQIKLDFQPKSAKDEDSGLPSDIWKKATVYEIWCSETETVYWICKGYEHGPLDQKKFPLKLNGKFPCPKPLYATMTTDTLIPVPDYVEYQDQADEIDELSGRIALLTKALKVTGVYNSAIKQDLQAALNGDENRLIPVEEWGSFADKGGMKGQVEYLPLKEVAETLMSLMNAREQAKQDLYEVTGLSDILRGQSKASETMGAQNIKARFGTLRMQDSIDDVQRFARDNMVLISEVIAENFQDETIREMAGMEMPTREEQAQAKQLLMQAQMMQQQMQQAQQQGQQVPQIQMPPQPKPEDIEKAQDIVDDVAFEDALELLRDDGMRTFRLDIETDSTLAVDAEADKKERVEFLGAAGGFMQSSLQMAQLEPDLLPLVSEMLMFGVRGFKASRSIESVFEDAMEGIKKKAKQRKDQPPQPDPKVALEQEKLKLKQAEIQTGQQSEKAQLQMKTQEVQASAALDNKVADQNFALEMRAQEFNEQSTVADHQLDKQKTEAEIIAMGNDARLKAIQALPPVRFDGR